jgi:polyisoprenoid-binding protein YceI
MAGHQVGIYRPPDPLGVHRTLHEVMRQYSLNRESLSVWKLKGLVIAIFVLLSAAAPVMAQQVQVTLDPAETKIEWTLGATLHVVHGTFKLRSGQMSYDPATGQANGELVVDATSGDSGNDSRDNKMNKDVLESKRYPEITFLPKKVSGQLGGQSSSTAQVQGILHIHGGDHDVTLAIPVQISGSVLKATTSFTVPYQAWGMKNPSTLFLHVDDKVQIAITAAGKIVKP